MKKRLIVMLLAVLLLCGTGCEGESQERDSIGQDAAFQEVYDAFMAEDGDLVFTEAGFSLSNLKMRAYDGFFTHRLINGGTFDEILAEGETADCREYYITDFHDRMSIIRRKGEKWEYLFQSDSMGYPFYWLERFINDPLWAFSERVNIKAAYFLMETVNYNHFVFYRTNKGNFVLYIDGYKEDAEVYLVPEDIFYEKMQESEIHSGIVYGSPYVITDFSEWNVEK